jgi:predicted RNA polymerase sigma factor
MDVPLVAASCVVLALVEYALGGVAQVAVKPLQVALARTDRRDDADAAYERAIGLETDPAVRRFLARGRR